MNKYDKNRHCPKCSNVITKDRWDYYPTKRDYDKKGILKTYKTKPLIRRQCKNCQFEWYELPNKI